MMKAIKRLGHANVKVILKSDNEASIRDVLNAVSEKRSSERIIESSPVNEPQSNGSVERAVGQIKGQVRTMKMALEDRVGANKPVNHPIMSWLVERAGVILSPYLISHDGKKKPLPEIKV